MLSPEFRKSFLSIFNDIVENKPTQAHRTMINYIATYEMEKQEESTAKDEHINKWLDKADELGLTDAEFMACHLNAMLNAKGEVDISTEVKAAILGTIDKTVSKNEEKIRILINIISSLVDKNGGKALATVFQAAEKLKMTDVELVDAWVKATIKGVLNIHKKTQN